MNTKPENKSVLWLFSISLLGFLPWLFVQWKTSVHGDMAWLLIAAKRLLDGEDMSAAYYDPNPPLSVILHAPPMLLAELTGLPVWYIAYGLILLLIVFSTVMAAKVLKHFSFLEALDRYALLLAFGAGATIISSISFGERDHLIGIILFPFALAQLGLNQGLRLPKFLQFAIFSVGTFLILVKPHFGIIPAVILLHRCCIRRDISAVKDMDFLILALGSIGYIAFITAFFPDYIEVILPDVLTLYLPDKDPGLALPMLFSAAAMFALVFVMELFMSETQGQKKTLMLWLYVLALLSLIPFAIQMKGYYYQILPGYMFFLVAFCTSILGYLRHYIQDIRWQAGLMIIMTFALAYSFRPLVTAYPTHDDYTAMPLAEALSERCHEKKCSAFVFHNNIEILPQTLLYTDLTWASRFPSFWFVPGIYSGLAGYDGAPVDTPQAVSLRQKYSDMVKDDLRRYRPELIFLMSNFYFADTQHMDFTAFFFLDDIMPQYQKVDTMSMNQGAYFAGTNLDQPIAVEYDIYVRKNTPSSPE